MRRIGDTLRKHKWWVALVLVVVAGYSVGKDLARQENARDVGISAEVRG